MFRTVNRVGLVGGPLQAGEVGRIFKRMAKAAGLDPVGLSGHSTRVGGAQDMVGAGLDVAEVMQASGWRTPVMVQRAAYRQPRRRCQAGATTRPRVTASRYSKRLTARQAAWRLLQGPGNRSHFLPLDSLPRLNAGGGGG